LNPRRKNVPWIYAGPDFHPCGKGVSVTSKRKTRTSLRKLAVERWIRPFVRYQEEKLEMLGHVCGSRAAFWGVLLLGVLPGSVFSQERPGRNGQEGVDIRDFYGTGVGLSSNVPNVLTGISVFRMKPAWGFGVFATGRMTFNSPGNDKFFERETTVAEARARGDERFQDRDVYRMFTVGAIRAIDSGLALFAGVGYTRKSAYREFWDEEEVRGDQGFYWVERHDEAQGGLNLTGGAMIQISNFLFLKGGGELFPQGANLSVYVALPY
jgi:hypothetical protein